MNYRMRTINLLLAVLALAGVLGCYMFFNIIRSNVMRAYVADSAADIQVARRQQAQMVRTTLDEIKPEVDSLSSRLVNTEGTILIIEKIEALGQAVGMPVTVNSVGVKGVDSKSKDPKAQNQTTENLLLSFSVNGSWDKIYTFLKVVESLPYKMAIQSVALSYVPAGKTSIWSGAFSVSILKNKSQ